MDFCFEILRLLIELLQLALEHPIRVCLLVALHFLLGGIVSATISHLWTEYVLKRVLPPAPSPTEDAQAARLADETRKRGCAEGERDAARRELAYERERNARPEAESRDVLSPRLRRLRSQRKTRRD